MEVVKLQDLLNLVPKIRKTFQKIGHRGIPKSRFTLGAGYLRIILNGGVMCAISDKFQKRP